MEINNLQKFLCLYYFVITDRDRSTQEMQKNNSIYDELMWGDLINKRCDLSELDSLFLIELRRMCYALLKIIKHIKMGRILKCCDKVKDVVLKLLQICATDPIYTPEVEKAADKYIKRGFKLDDKDFRLLACIQKYNDQFPCALNSMRNAVEVELNKRKELVAGELKKYGITLGVDIKGDELYDKKKIKGLIKRKLAKELGINPTDAQLKDFKKLKKAIIDKLKEDMAKTKDLEDVDKLCARYTYISSGDLINGFLRGDLCLRDDEQPEQSSSWGTDLHVGLTEFLDIAQKALKLKYVLYGSALGEQVVYRGLSFDKLLASITRNQDEAKAVYESVCLNKKYGILAGKIYQSKDITSTSVDFDIAVDHTFRTMESASVGLGVIMRIEIKEGTAFGINFSKTKLKDSSFAHELILKPKQKIRINKVNLEFHDDSEVLFLTCETIKG